MVIALYVDKIASVSEGLEDGGNHIFGEAIESDHAAEIDVIVPGDKVSVPHSSKTGTLAEEKRNPKWVQYFLGFLQHRLREFRIYPL